VDWDADLTQDGDDHRALDNLHGSIGKVVNVLQSITYMDKPLTVYILPLKLVLEKRFLLCFS